MRLTCSQKELSKALSITTKAVDVNNTLPVLNNVLLKAEGKKLHFTATNLEVAVTYFLETEVKNEGEITLPAKLLSNYVNFLKDDQIEMVVEGTDIQVKTSDSKTRIKGIPAAEFPPIPQVEKEAEVTIKVSDFKKAVGQVVFAAAMNTTRPILGGVFLKLGEDGLLMVSTDSYRLSEKTIPVQKKSGEIVCVIPAKTILELGAILEVVDPEISLDLWVSKNQVMFSVGNIQLISRLIEGQFPNYQQIIPKSSLTQVEFEVSDLTLALKRINIFAKENNNKVVLKVAEGKILITTESTQYGEGEITMSPEIKGEPNEVALNSQFLLEALANLASSKVIMEIGEKVNPVILKPKEEKGYLHIIMPLKI